MAATKSKKKLIILPSLKTSPKLLVAVIAVMLPIIFLWGLMTVRQINSVAWLGFKNNPKLKQAQNDLTNSLKELPQALPASTNPPTP